MRRVRTVLPSLVAAAVLAGFSAQPATAATAQTTGTTTVGVTGGAAKAGNH
ncbi:hypothetical protein [Gordonia sp. (in: high G+C Gram-positive bacteria)]|uniref:hypothetical protein n=1 Tax=Gordonia sp. (in: high G+C Gram-positive bacteria) TaxID=84139 RepID=UPI002636A728|nr:hypothetical protein [Gordonia sp. (in: high G+C Gram-positive bacteria)]